MQGLRGLGSWGPASPMIFRNYFIAYNENYRKECYMLKKLKEHKDIIATGCVVALTITVIVTNRRVRYVTDVMITNGKSLVIEYSDGTSNIYDLKQ